MVGAGEDSCGIGGTTGTDGLGGTTAWTFPLPFDPARLRGERLGGVTGGEAGRAAEAAIERAP